MNSEITLNVKKKKTSLFVDVLKGTVRSPGSKVGVVIILLMIFISIAAPLLTPYQVDEMDLGNLFSHPSAAHIFGTDSMGRDLFTRVLYGGRYSLAIGFVASGFTTVVAIILGCIAGYVGGIVETVIMRIMDVISSLPSMLLCIMVATALGNGFFNTVLALALSQVPHSVRMMRSKILSERTKEYLEAAETINCSKLSIMFRHMLPNVISPMIVCFTMGVGDNITMAASLSYIGLGVQPPTPEWGALLADARTHILNYPYLCLFPGIFIALTVFAINILGDGLRDAIDPKLRK